MRLAQTREAQTLPMGYLICGAVGTGKTFLAQCMAGEIGVPVRDAQEFSIKVCRRDRGNYGAGTEVLRAMDPWWL